MDTLERPIQRHTLDWLIHDSVGQPYYDNLFGGLCRRLVKDGLPLDRATTHIRTLHPQFMGGTVFWEPQMPEAELVMIGHDMINSPQYRRSPVRSLFEGEIEGIRQRLDIAIPDGAPTYAIYEDLRAKGFTDYVAMPMMFVSGTRHCCSWATKRPGGFTTAELTYLDEVRPLLAMAMEIRLNRRIAKNLLNTYVGQRAGERILAGQITRGSGETVTAAIWHCDLRGFTMLSEQAPRDEVIDTLNAYFDVMAGPVIDNGGEILKFIGDAMLAIFPLENRQACSRAFSAGLRARRDMREMNARRRERGANELGFGLSLHVGDVMYGNIGAVSRLDFTVIGPAVNTAARIEELSKELRREFLISGAFVGLCDGLCMYLERVGKYRLRSVANEVEVYAPPDDW